MNRLCRLCILSGLTPISLEAQITYIDASPANTINLPPADGSVVGGWRGRGAGLGQGTANFANEGGAYEAAAGSGEASAVNLITTISVPNGTYEVFTFFWSDRTGTATDDWDITTGFVGGATQQYTTTSSSVFAINASTQSIPETTVSGMNVLGQTPDDYSDFIDGNRTLYAAPIGTIVVTAGQFQVDVDSCSLMAGRTWYDGIGYSFQGTPAPLVLTIAASAPDTPYLLSWKNDGESQYTIESSPDLSAGSWTTVQENIDADPSGTNTLEVDPEASVFFYRVQKQ